MMKIVVLSWIVISVAMFATFCWWKFKGSRTRSLPMILLIAVIISTLSWWLAEAFTPLPSEPIIVTALNQKNEKSQQASIYIIGVSVHYGSVPIEYSDSHDWFLDGGWLMWKNTSVDTSDENRTVTLSVPVGTQRRVSFLGNEWKGFVQVSYGDTVQTLDCYSEENTTIDCQIPDSSSQLMRAVHFRQFSVLVILSSILLACFYLFILPAHKTYDVNCKRNGLLEFMRFVMTLAVIIHHFKNYGDGSAFVAGYLSVDVFFVISGFFLMKHYTSHDHVQPAPVDAFDYFKSRVKSFLPHHIFSWLIVLCVGLLIGRFTEQSIADEWWTEFLLLKSFGLGVDIDINGVCWYLSALLICSYVIYYLLCRNKAQYLYIIAPLSFFAVFSYLYNDYGMLNRWTQKTILFTDGLWRGFAEIGLGCIVYAVCQRYQSELSVSTLQKIFSSLFEVASWSFILWHMWYGGNRLDFLVPIIAAMLLFSQFSFSSLFSQIFNNNISLFLGRMSFPMYLNQYILLHAVKKYFPNHSFRGVTILVITGIFLLSIFSEWFVRKVSARVFVQK